MERRGVRGCRCCKGLGRVTREMAGVPVETLCEICRGSGQVDPLGPLDAG